MNRLQAGFARADITPMRGIPVVGYFIDRNASGVLDNLEVNVVSLRCGEDTVLLLSLDLLNCGQTVFAVKARERISAATGVPVDAIFFHCTHTHTGPALTVRTDPPIDESYAEKVHVYADFVLDRVCDASLAAIEDLKPARMGYRIGQAPDIAFVRRFRMKDGSVRTNPGINNPNVLSPIGDVDERVNVLRFDREGAPSIALANFGDHPDTIGGDKISADWPGFVRRTFERAMPDTRCIFFNGAQRDVNHVKVFPQSGDFNGMAVDFDDVSRGYAHARHMGQVVAGSILQVWEKVNYTDVDSIRHLFRVVDIPSNMPDPADLPEAHRIHDLHVSGRDAELPYEGMLLTTKVAAAGRMVRLEHGPAAFPMPFTAIAVGKIAFFGIPGEPFNGIGRAVKEAPGWDLVLPCCLVNGNEGYFPMRDAYDEGGYEAGTSNFRAGVAELIIREGLDMLDELKK